MDLKQSKPMCWEITGCGREDGCKVLHLAKSSGKPCWEVVGTFDDYRSALNVCGDCIVSVLSQHHSLSVADIKDNKTGNNSHHTCPGMLMS